MEITTITAVPAGFRIDADDLEDVTHGCLQCGTTVIRTMRSQSRLTIPLSLPRSRDR
jgi:hypothetical protein